MSEDSLVTKVSAEIETTQQQKYEIEARQTAAMEGISQSLTALASFVTKGGLVEVLSGYSRALGVGQAVQGLLQHSGRAGLDARTMKQDAVEIVHKIEQVFEKYNEVVKAKASGEIRDEDLQNAEDEYLKWKEKNGAEPKS